MDPSPLLVNSIATDLLRSRRIVRRRTPPPLRRAARLLRRASGRRMMLREPSVQVRETAAEALEARQSGWAHSRPVIVLDVLWNLAFVVSGLSVLAMSLDEKPSEPLRLWICGYVMHCTVRVACVIAQYVWRRRGSPESESDVAVESGSSSASDVDSYENDMNDDGDGDGDGDEYDHFSSVARNLEFANTMFSFVWWMVGFYWVTTGGESLTRDSPQIYWLCITFLAFDVVFVIICVTVVCLVGIAVCCCLPCIIAILYAVTDQEGATKEEIESLPKFKFRLVGDSEKVNGVVQESFRGIMVECNTDSPTERPLSEDDAECCICLSSYDEEAELRELPCRHHFHCTCIDKWLQLNATCPLCKFDILKMNNRSHDSQV